MEKILKLCVKEKINIEEFKKTGQSVVFSFTNDEETDIESIRDVIAFLKQQNVKPKYAFLGEPTDLHLATQSTGYMAFKTTINGGEKWLKKPN